MLCSYNFSHRLFPGRLTLLFALVLLLELVFFSLLLVSDVLDLLPGLLAGALLIFLVLGGREMFDLLASCANNKTFSETFC